MDDGVRQVLQTTQNESSICIQLCYLLPELRKRKLVTDLEFRLLSDDKKSAYEKNKALLDIIETKGGEKSFDLFVQALQAEKQHTGHEHLADVLVKAKAGLKTRLVPPQRLPKPLPKPQKKDFVDIHSSSQDWLSSLNDQVKQINHRLTNLEHGMEEIRQTLHNAPFENKINMAMESLNEKMYALQTILESHRNDHDDYLKKPIPATEYDDVRVYSRGTAAVNDYVEDQYCSVPQLKAPDQVKKLPLEPYMVLQRTGDQNETKYEKPANLQKPAHIQKPQNDYIEMSILAKGNSGEFWLAVGNTDRTKVVIKKVTESTTTLGEEVHALKSCLHPNIIRMISPILSPSQKIPSLVFEYAEKGQLKEYLQHEKRNLCESKLIDMATGVSCGMTELERKGIMHCDLRASNILIDGDLVCKIASFNKVQFLKGNEKYKICKSHRMATRWQAPEVLSDYKFSIKSDIWSFGVFLSELFTYGERPYPDIKRGDDVQKFVLNKNKMSQPSQCPKDVYKLMKDCFEFHIERRPSFDNLNKQLKVLQSKWYRKSSSDSEEYS